MKSLTGSDLDDQAFVKLWNVIQDEIANMFLRNGIYVTQAISSILAGAGTVKDHPELREAIAALGGKVASLQVFGPRASFRSTPYAEKRNIQ
jgi:hypothetical protein